MRIGTPNNIEVLLHCYVNPGKHPRFEAPAVQDAIAMLLQEGCIRPVGDDIYQTTPRGGAWVLALCNVERPREVYLDTQGNILN